MDCHFPHAPFEMDLGVSGGFPVDPHDHGCESQSSDSEFDCEEGQQIPTYRRGFDDFITLKTVGEGAYGKVFQVRCKSNGKIYAMKVLKKEHLLKQDAILSTITERDILVKVKHSLVIPLYASFQNDTHVGFIMQFINGGQLFFHLREQAMFNEERATFYVAELVLALEYLHSEGIIHRDLKPENILIGRTGHIVLTDFGLAKDKIDEHTKTRTWCGTIEYMSPQMIKGDPYGKETDWWSVGILLYDMLNGRPPWRHGNKAKLQEMILAKKLVLNKLWRAPTHNILKGLIQRDVDKRLTVSQIKAHPFFKGIDWEGLNTGKIAAPFIPPTPQGQLDLSNFDPMYTSRSVDFSPAGQLSTSQNALFGGFSFARSFSPASVEGDFLVRSDRKSVV